MNIEMKRNAEVTTIEITGRLDTTTAPVLDKMINEDIEGTKDLILDMKGLEYISSAGLRVLLSAQKKMMKILPVMLRYSAISETQISVKIKKKSHLRK